MFAKFLVVLQKMGSERQIRQAGLAITTMEFCKIKMFNRFNQNLYHYPERSALRCSCLHVAYIYSVCGGSKRACLPGPMSALWECFPTYIPAAPHGEEPGCTEVYVNVEIVP